MKHKHKSSLMIKKNMLSIWAFNVISFYCKWLANLKVWLVQLKDDRFSLDKSKQ